MKIRQEIEEQHGQYVTARDIQNLRQTLQNRGVTDEDDLWNEVQHCATEFGSSIVAVADDNGELMILFWQSEFMKKMYSSYPSMLFMDGTYKINNRNMPLYSLMIVDGEGKGQVVGYAVVREETAPVLARFLKIFTDNNPLSADSLSVVVVDKDYAEISAIDAVFENAHVVLCKMHVLDAFRRAFKGHNLTAVTRDELRDTLQTMVHSKTETAYDTAKEQLSVISQTFAQYFMQHWDPIKHMWAGYIVKTLPHFGFTTNNTVESHNAKIKRVLNHHSKLADVLRQLFLLEGVKIKERNIEMQRMLATRTRIVGPVNGDRSVQEQLYEVATMHAAKLSLAQLSKSTRDHTAEQGVQDGDWDVKVESGQQHTVTGLKQCDCTHFMTTGLPCAHIFIARSHEGLSKFSSELIPVRWLKRQYLETSHESHAPAASTVTCDASQRRRAKASHDKYAEASRVTGALATLLASVGQNEYDEKLGKLQFLLDVWTDGDDISWDRVTAPASTGIDYDEADTAGETAQARTEDSEVQSVVQHRSPSPAPVDNGPGNTTAENEVNAESADTGESSSGITSMSQIKLPKAFKVRGRPKGAGRTVIGQKRKIAGNTSSKQPKRQTRTNPAVHSTDSICDNICYSCYSEDPPREVSTAAVIMWAECDNSCGRWFHAACVNGVVPYVCAWCT